MIAGAPAIASIADFGPAIWFERDLLMKRETTYGQAATRNSMRVLSTSETLSATTSATRSPAP